MIKGEAAYAVANAARAIFTSLHDVTTEQMTECADELTGVVRVYVPNWTNMAAHEIGWIADTAQEKLPPHIVLEVLGCEAPQ